MGTVDQLRSPRFKIKILFFSFFFALYPLFHYNFLEYCFFFLSNLCVAFQYLLYSLYSMDCLEFSLVIVRILTGWRFCFVSLVE